MRLSLLLFLSLLALPAAAQNWESLNNKLTELFNAGNYQQAIPYAEQALEAAKKEFGTEHINYATSLDNLSQVYLKTGQYDKAEPPCITATDIYKKIFGEEHIDYGISLSNLAVIIENRGQFSRAESLYLRATTIMKTAVGETDPWYTITLGNLAGLYLKQGQYHKAEAIYLQVKEITKKTAGENSETYATLLNNLGIVYERMGEYNRAESLYIESGNITRALLGEAHWRYGVGLNSLAVLYEVTGQYEKAEGLYLRIGTIFKSGLGETHPYYLTALSNRGALYKKMGRYEDAETILGEVKLAYEKASAQNHPDYATLLNNLAALYSETGKHKEAEWYYLQAAALRKKMLGANHPGYATVLNNLAGLYKEIGQKEKAIAIYTEAGTVYKNAVGENHPSYALLISNLAVAYRETGDYKNAIDLSLKAITIYKNKFGEAHPEYALSLRNLAAIYEDARFYDNAENLYLIAAVIYQKALGDHHPEYAVTLNNLGNLYYHQDQFGKARQFYLRAKEINQKAFGAKHPFYASGLLNTGLSYLGEKQYREAEPFLLAYQEIEKQNLKTTFTFLSENEKGKYIARNYSLLNLIHSCQAYPVSAAMRKEGLNFQLFSKSLVLADTRHMIASIRQSGDTSVKRLFNHWQATKKLLSVQYTLPPEKRIKDLPQKEAEAETAEKELVRRSEGFAVQQKSAQLTFQDIREKLGDNEAALEFVSFTAYAAGELDSMLYAVYILRKGDSIPVFVPLFEEKQLQRILDSAGRNATSMVNNIYRGLEGKSKSAGALGTELYKLVWAPLELHLEAIKKISYSPAGKLYGIAFHALPADSTTLLMDKYELRQYTSTRQVALRKIENRSSKIESIVLFGDAAFSMDSTTLAKTKGKGQPSSGIYTPRQRGESSGSWSNLPGTAEEVRKVKLLFDTNKIASRSFTQAAATEENLKALSDQSPQVLHIATHGFFLPEPDKKRKNAVNNDNSYSLAEDPLLRSGLILAGGNYAWSGKTPVEGVEDGIATAYEISQLDLSNTELVVLSACETALGDVKGSEGVFGLQRAFKMAGVKKMIVSLWQVPDKETAELMTNFYTYWLKGKTIEEAFAQSQAEMRKKYPPYYWAAFVLIE